MGTFTLRKKFTFEAAHFLPQHQGKCRRLHGHSWVGWIEIQGHQLQPSGPAAGMVVDYSCLSQAIKPILDQYLDHYCLNETLGVESPTSEAIAQWVFEQLETTGLPVSAVTIEETCTSVCTYRK
jgi:6-pyruvoyltetrahydropterin/6-carboxytetrahydropterin synthase